jgi:hypothetical protein
MNKFWEIMTIMFINWYTGSFQWKFVILLNKNETLDTHSEALFILNLKYFFTKGINILYN